VCVCVCVCMCMCVCACVMSDFVYVCVCVRVWVSGVVLSVFAFAAMGWLRLVGSIKLYASFAEYWLFCRALLQKRPIILSMLLTKAIPYLWRRFCVCVCFCLILCMYVCVCVWWGWC